MVSEPNSDLAAPMVESISDEHAAFFAFKHFMVRMKPNFLRDQSGMRDQLRKAEVVLKLIDLPLHQHFFQTDCVNMFMCFRWLLVLFKREFHYDDIKTLWECKLNLTKVYGHLQHPTFISLYVSLS
jgi:TBC1 domain family member 15